jgi:stringent starvation protein B
VGYDATRNLDISNDWISFQARFGGVPRSLRIPVIAVHSIYARESGEGLVFPPESDGPPTLGDSATIGSGSVDEPTQDPPTPPTPRRPSLKVVK